MLKNFPIFFWGANCSQIYFSHYLTTHKPKKVFWWSEVENTRENLYFTFQPSISLVTGVKILSREREGENFVQLFFSLQHAFFPLWRMMKMFFGFRILEARELVFFPFSRKTWRIFWLPKSWIDEWQLSVILQLEKKTIFRKKSWFGTAAGFGSAPYFWTFKKMPSRLLPIKLYFSLSIRAWMQSIEASPIS